MSIPGDEERLVEAVEGGGVRVVTEGDRGEGLHGGRDRVWVQVVPVEAAVGQCPGGRPRRRWRRSSGGRGSRGPGR